MDVDNGPRYPRVLLVVVHVASEIRRASQKLTYQMVLCPALSLIYMAHDIGSLFCTQVVPTIR